MRPCVLVADGNPEQADLLQRILTTRGYDVRIAGDADAALASLRSWNPALMIAELTMPRVNGLELWRRVRQTSTIPLIVVSSKIDGPSEVAVLDAGADDFIMKPFHTESLLARVRAALRRTGGTPPEAAVLGVGEFRIDFHDHRVEVHGQAVRLTPKEFDLFVFMARNPNRVLPHKTLLGAVWGEGSAEQPEYLRVFMGQLRKKFEADPANPRYLVTEPWVGYRFNPTGVVH